MRIAVIRLPHISNFTDFELLEQYASSNMCRPVPLIPMTASLSLAQNTIDDLAVLKKRGRIANWWKPVKERSRSSVSAGVTRCWGEPWWMRVLNPQPVLYEGFGLLESVTRFPSYAKNTTQVRREAKPVSPILSSMGEVTGYEIHMGITDRR